jgi:hypothetical protein
VARRVVSMFQRFASPRTEHSGLSERELEVLGLLAEGHSYKTCADRWPSASTPSGFTCAASTSACTFIRGAKP